MEIIIKLMIFLCFMETPLISVVIPTFNRSELLVKAIKSVLNQDYSNFELFVCDDGSTDGTEEMIKSIKDERLTYLKQENKGCAAARNLGIRNAKGELIAFLDDDDAWLPDHLKYIAEFFDLYPEAAMGYTQNDVRLPDGSESEPIKYKKEVIPHDEKKEGFWLYKDIVFDKYLFSESDMNAPSCTAIRKKVFDEIGLLNEDLRVNQDHELFLRISNRFKIGVIRKVTVQYLVHQGRISTIIQRKKLLNNRIIIYNSIKENCTLNEKEFEFIEKKIDNMKKELFNL